MPETIRKRVTSHVNKLPKYSASYEVFSGGVWGPPSLVSYEPEAERFNMVSYSHKGPPYKRGGPWFMQKSLYDPYIMYVPETVVNGGAGTRYRYSGQYGLQWKTPTGAPVSWSLGLRGSPSDFDAYGPTGYARARPGQPVTDLGNYLGELKDFGSLFQFKLKSYKDFASGYLQYEFGWKPFVRDLIGFLKTAEKLDKQIQQLRRDNGKLIRRRVTLKSSGQSYQQSGYNPTIYGVDGIRARPLAGSGFAQLTVQENVWYAGAFTYWIPKVDSQASRLRMAIKLLGLSPTPELVWNLLSYSWLADWLSNTGDVMSAVSANAAENLVQRYGFIMGSSTYTLDNWGSLELQQLAGNRVTRQMRARSVNTYKTRSTSGPFAWGSTWESLSGRQIAILAALGISRS